MGSVALGLFLFGFLEGERVGFVRRGFGFGSAWVVWSGRFWFGWFGSVRFWLGSVLVLGTHPNQGPHLGWGLGLDGVRGLGDLVRLFFVGRRVGVCSSRARVRWDWVWGLACVFHGARIAYVLLAFGGCLGAATRAHRWRDDRGAAERQRTQRPPLWALVVAASVPWLIPLLFGECSSSFFADLLDESSSSALLLVWSGLPSRSCTRSGRSDILHCTPLGKGVTFALGSPHPL